MAVGNLYRCQMQYVVDGIPCTLNTAHRMTVDGGGPAECSDLADAYDAVIAVALVACLPASCQLSYLQAHKIFPADSIPGSIAYNENTTIGTFGGDVLPANVSVYLKMITNAPSGHMNGHAYLSGVPEDAVDGAVFSGPWMAGVLTALCNAIKNDISHAGSTWESVTAVLSVGPPRSPTGAYHKIIGVSYSSRLSGLRKRTARPQFTQ